MGTWDYSSIPSSQRGYFEFNETSDGLKITVKPGAAVATYTITYTDGDCTASAQIKISEDCSGGGGGGCSDISINIKETITELTKTGGEIVFEHGTVPVPPTPVGDCETGRAWTASYLMNTSLNTIYDTGKDCCDDTYDESDPQAWKPKNGNVTVKIVNNSNYYIPFNGEIKYKGSQDVKHYFRNETSNGHFRYGSVVAQGYDTNFFVPPHTTATLENCQGSSIEAGEYHFYISVLCSTAPSDTNSEGYVAHNEDISNNNECTSSYDLNSKTITFTIPANVDGTRWRGDDIDDGWGHHGNFHYALTLDEIRNAHGNRFSYSSGSGDKARVIPVYLNSDADWSAIETALTTKNSNNYYPYTIT